MTRIRNWVFITLFIGLLAGNVASVPLDVATAPNLQQSEVYLPLIQRLSTDSLDSASIFLKKRAWEAESIQSYEYTLARLCFCPPPFRARVRVENGLITSIVDIDSDTPLTADSGFGISIDALYAQITDLSTQTLNHFEVEYDPDQHYPIYVAVDYQNEVADDEIVYWAEDLVVINP